MESDYIFTTNKCIIESRSNNLKKHALLDITVICNGDHKIRASKHLLYTHSQYFNSLFTPPFSEQNTDSITMELDADIAEIMLNYIQWGETLKIFEKLSSECTTANTILAIKLISAFDKYFIADEYTKMITKYLKNIDKIDVNDLFVIYQFIDKCNVANLDVLKQAQSRLANLFLDYLCGKNRTGKYRKSICDSDDEIDTDYKEKKKKNAIDLNNINDSTIASMVRQLLANL